MAYNYLYEKMDFESQITIQISSGEGYTDLVPLIECHKKLLIT